MLVTKETSAQIIADYLAMLSLPSYKNQLLKNLTASFCKVAERELEDKLAKKPRRRLEEELVKVPLANGEENTSTST